MADRFILADLTSHRRGFGVQSVLKAAARRAQKNDPPSKLVWIIPSDLTTAFTGLTPVICDNQGLQAWGEIERQIGIIRSQDPNAEIQVVTWEYSTYKRSLISTFGLTGAKWFDLLNEDRSDRSIRRQAGASILPISVSGDVPSRKELEEQIVAYLRLIGATSAQSGVYRSQLRPGLVRRNPQLQQFLSNPLFGPALRNAVDSAILENRLAQPISRSGQERLWIIEQQPDPAPIPAQSVQPGFAASDLSTATSRPNTAPVYARTAEFRKRLTDLGIFCEKRDRDILFEALARLLKESPSPISRLRRELPKIAVEIAKERQLPDVPEFKRTVNFFLKLLLMSGVLLNKDNKVIRRNLESEAASVARLDDSALDRAEQYLLEQIMKKSDVKDREHWQLALAIFRQFDASVEIDGMLDRVAFLLVSLKDRFVLTEDGTYECVDTAGSKVVAMRG
jgi:hypothetical protein